MTVLHSSMLVRVKIVAGGGLVPLMAGEDHIPESIAIMGYSI